MIEDTPSVVPRLAIALTGLSKRPDDRANRFQGYGATARLAALAAAREQRRIAEPRVAELKRHIAG